MQHSYKALPGNFSLYSQQLLRSSSLVFLTLFAVKRLCFCKGAGCSSMVLHWVSQECPSFHLDFTFSFQSFSRFLRHFFPLCPLKEDDNDESNREGGRDGGGVQKGQTKGVWIPSLSSSIGIWRILRSVLEGKALGMPKKEKGMQMMVGPGSGVSSGTGRRAGLGCSCRQQLPRVAVGRDGCSLVSFPDGRTWLLMRGRAARVLPISYVRKYSSQLLMASPGLRI